MEKEKENGITPNLRFYEQSREVPENAKKSFNNGRFSGTDINPVWRIEKLTEMFGPCGIGWYFKPVCREMKEAPDGTICTFVAVELYIKVDGQWSEPIYGEGGNSFFMRTSKGVMVTDEAYKMAYTDAQSNAAKLLGIGADVWFKKDRTKYDS